MYNIMYLVSENEYKKLKDGAKRPRIAGSKENNGCHINQLNQTKVEDGGMQKIFNLCDSEGVNYTGLDPDLKIKFPPNKAFNKTWPRGRKKKKSTPGAEQINDSEEGAEGGEGEASTVIDLVNRSQNTASEANSTNDTNSSSTGGIISDATPVENPPEDPDLINLTEVPPPPLPQNNVSSEFANLYDTSIPDEIFNTDNPLRPIIASPEQLRDNTSRPNESTISSLYELDNAGQPMPLDDNASPINESTISSLHEVVEPKSPPYRNWVDGLNIDDQYFDDTWGAHSMIPADASTISSIEDGAIPETASDSAYERKMNNLIEMREIFSDATIRHLLGSRTVNQIDAYMRLRGLMPHKSVARPKFATSTPTTLGPLPKFDPPGTPRASKAKPVLATSTPKSTRSRPIFVTETPELTTPRTRLKTPKPLSQSLIGIRPLAPLTADMSLSASLPNPDLNTTQANISSDNPPNITVAAVAETIEPEPSKPQNQQQQQQVRVKYVPDSDVSSISDLKRPSPLRKPRERLKKLRTRVASVDYAPQNITDNSLATTTSDSGDPDYQVWA